MQAIAVLLERVSARAVHAAVRSKTTGRQVESWMRLRSPRGSAGSRRAKAATNEDTVMNPLQNYFMGKGCSAGAARSEFVRFRDTGRVTVGKERLKSSSTCWLVLVRRKNVQNSQE